MNCGRAILPAVTSYYAPGLVSGHATGPGPQMAADVLEQGNRARLGTAPPDIDIADPWEHPMALANAEEMLQCCASGCHICGILESTVSYGEGEEPKTPVRLKRFSFESWKGDSEDDSQAHHFDVKKPQHSRSLYERGF